MLGEQYVTTSSEAALIAHSHLVFAASRRACELAACPASSRQPAIPRRFAGGPSKLSTPQPHIVLIAIFSHSPRGLFAVAPRALTNISPSLCLYPSSAYALLLLRLPRPTLSSARAADLKEHRGHFSGRAAGLARMQIVLNFLPDISGEPSRPESKAHILLWLDSQPLHKVGGQSEHEPRRRRRRQRRRARRVEAASRWTEVANFDYYMNWFF